jgi:hypothetical protein
VEPIVSNDCINIIVISKLEIASMPGKQEAHLLARQIISRIEKYLTAGRKRGIFIAVSHLKRDTQRR